jgi:hypothetical protein
MSEEDLTMEEQLHRCNFDDFGDGKGGHKPRKAGILQKLEKAKK